MGILAAVFFWRIAQIDGFVTPILVSGPSMSPTLWGPHRRAVCEECGFAPRIHASSGTIDRTLRCFLCGRLGAEPSAEILAGDRVLIDRAAYLLSAPERGDLVAIRMASGQLQVKRIVGLPGETVAIDREGHLRVDDQRLEMSPEDSWRRSIVVDDDRHRGPAGSRWKKSSAGNWLVYHHRDIYKPEAGSRAHGTSGEDAGPRIRDDDPANATLSRLTRPVEDLQLSLRVRSAEPCRLEVVFAAEPQPLRARVEVEAGERTVRITKIGDAVWHLTAEGEPRRVDAGGPRPTGEAPELSLARPLAIRLRGRGAEGETAGRIDRLWLGRSVRYDPPRRYAERWLRGVPVAEDHYLVIGDNPPASQDSRSAPEGIARKRIIGQVTPWPF